MKGIVPIAKMSKKAKREYYSRQRRDWGGLSPVTRCGSTKGYARAADKAEWKKAAVEAGR